MTTTQRSTADKAYKALFDLLNLPIRNRTDAAKFVDTCYNQRLTLERLAVELRRNLTNVDDRDKYDHLNACEVTISGLKYFESWYAGADKFDLLTSFDNLQELRGILSKTIESLKPLCNYEFIIKYLPKKPEIVDETSLIRYWLEFLKFSKYQESLYKAIFGVAPLGIYQTKEEAALYLRLQDILMMKDSGNLTRTEQLDFDARGFTRQSIKDFLKAIERRTLSEPEPEFRKLYIDYYNDLTSQELMKPHLELI